ncbi:MAG: hypothetical protein IJP27_03845 [Clostridia bacterium]|nr:hypothetical protein [Clostridia bacterium]
MTRHEEVIKYQEFLEGVYLHAEGWFGKNFAHASERKRRRVRRWIRREYADEIAALRPEFAAPFKTPALLGYLESRCRHDDMNQLVVARFPKDVQVVLRALLKAPEWPGIERRGPDMIIREETAAFCCELILKNADGDPDSGEYEIEDVALVQQDNGNYQLTFWFYNAPPYRVSFADLELKTEIFRLHFPGVYENPWNHFQRIGAELCYKAELPGEPLNEEEKELFPILNELACLSYAELLEESMQVTEFPYLRAILRGKPAILLAALEKVRPDGFRFRMLVKKLIETLNKPEWEELWRRLYGMIEQSQKAYPDKVAVRCPPEQLAEARERFTALFRELGYAGEYPDFYREGAQKHLRLAESYGALRLVSPQKRMHYRIHCIEEWSDDRLKIRFLCGAAVLEPEEVLEDITACAFDKGNRRFLYYVCYDRGLRPRDWEVYASVAAKKAELRPLNRKEYGFFSTVPPIRIFASAFVLMGGSFGFLMVPGMMLAQFFICLVLDRLSDFPDLLQSTPWIQVMMICWVGFGLLIGTFHVLTQRK